MFFSVWVLKVFFCTENLLEKADAISTKQFLEGQMIIMKFSDFSCHFLTKADMKNLGKTHVLMKKCSIGI